jgi:hypothetical protein
MIALIDYFDPRASANVRHIDDTIKEIFRRD